MTLKGRHWVILWLAAFLVTAGTVALRAQKGLATAGRLRALREERASLEARQADLQRRIRQASSRAVLVPKAEALGLHEPHAEEFDLIQLAPPTARP